MYALVRKNTELSLFLQMDQGYHKDHAARLNTQLDLYAENPRYQNLFINLVRSDTGKKKYCIFPMQQYQKLGSGEFVLGLHLSHIQATQQSKVQASQNKNAFKNVKSGLGGDYEIRTEEAINFTRNTISLPKVFYFLLYFFYFEQYLFRDAQFSEAGLNGAQRKRKNNTKDNYRQKMEQLSTAKVLEAQFGLDLKGLLRLSPNLYKSCSLLRASGDCSRSWVVFRSGRVVQYCRLESSRILFLSIGKPEVQWCKVLPSVLDALDTNRFRWKSSFFYS